MLRRDVKKSAALRRLLTAVAVLAACLQADAADKIKMKVKIIDRRNNESAYAYVVPGYVRTDSNANANCSYGPCTGRGTTTGTVMPSHTVEYTVQGATLSLLLPDDRVAVVNCAGTPAAQYVSARSCLQPITDDIYAEFKGDKATLKWPVSVDGKKLQSETYRIIGIVDKRGQ